MKLNPDNQTFDIFSAVKLIENENLWAEKDKLFGNKLFDEYADFSYLDWLSSFAGTLRNERKEEKKILCAKQSRQESKKRFEEFLRFFS